MGTSRTSKKRKKPLNKKVYAKAQEQATDETVSELLRRFVTHWGNKELAKLSTSTTFVCLEIDKNLYRVGRFNLLKQSDHSWVVSDLDGNIVHNFFNHQAAVFYCLCETKKIYHKAYEFLSADRDVGKLHQELKYLEYKLKKAQQQANQWNQQLYIARISWVRPRLDLLQTNLQKTIIAAKYTKSLFGNLHHETVRHSH